MEVIAKKSKELETKSLIHAIVTAVCSIVLLIVQIICWVKLKWRWSDLVTLLLLICNLGVAVMEGLEYLKLKAVGDVLITYQEEKVCFFDEFAFPNELTNVYYEISEESKNKDWGTLYFTVEEKEYAQALVADVKAVYAYLLSIGATKKEDFEEAVEETAEATEEAAITEVAEETVEETVEENAEIEVTAEAEESEE